jgi:hypothetical protein
MSKLPNVESGIAAPPSTHGNTKYPLRLLAVGDSFAIACLEANSASLAHSMQNSAAVMRHRRQLPREYRLATLWSSDGTLRVWRIT